MMMNKHFLRTSGIACLTVCFIGISHASAQNLTATARPSAISAPQADDATAPTNHPLDRQRAARPVAVNAKAANGQALQLYGNLIYRSDWTAAHYGIYTFETKAPAQPTLIEENQLYANGGATYIPDGHYYVASRYDQQMGQVSNPRLAIYDADTWECFGELYSDFSIMAFDLCWNPQDNKIYGAFFNSFGESNSTHLGTLNMWEGDHKRIASLPEPIVALTCTGEGVMYGVAGGSGNVYRITTDGESEKIGETGLNPDYIQSMTYDYRTKQIYWCATTQNTAGLYTIDQTDGHATLIADWTNHLDEWVGVFSTTPYAPDEAPDMCSDLTADFDGPSLTGTVSFTLPQTTFGGEALGDEITYIVTVDGQETVTGQAQPGTRQTVEISVNQGNRTIAVIARNDGGDSPAITLKRYIGYDKPAPSASVVATRNADGTVSIRWDAVSEGQNGGYIDASTLTYDVVRKPDWEYIAEGTTELEALDDIELGNYALYTYEVTANTDTQYGRAATSNGLLMGHAYEPPYQSDMAQAKHRATYSMADANGDGNTWTEFRYSSGEYTFRYRYDYNDQAADDWLFTAPIHLQAGHLYRISNTAYNTGRVERMEVKAGQQPTVEAMTEQVMAAYDLPDEGYDIQDTASVYFRPTATADYYLGFHAVSNPNQFWLILTSWKIEEAVSAQAPVAPELALKAGEQGAREATITLTMPTTDADGQPLSQLTAATVSNHTTGRTIATIDAPQPGQTYTVTDSEPENELLNQYAAVAANEVGRGQLATAKVWVGYDEPQEVMGVKWTQQGNKAVVTWDAVGDTGCNGGYVDASQVTYNVLRRNPLRMLARGLTECSFEEEPSTDGQQQTTLSYAVYAVCNDMVGNDGRSQIASFGEGYGLPFVESFPDGEAISPAWSISDMGANPSFETSWGVYYEGWSSPLMPQDSDNGMILLHPNGGGTSTLASPLISLENTGRPVLEFYANRSNDMATCDVLVSTDNAATWQPLTSIDVTGIAKWKKQSIDLSDYIGETITLGFRAVASYINTEVAIDNLTLIDEEPTGIDRETVLRPAIQTQGLTLNVANCTGRVEVFTLNGTLAASIISNGNAMLRLPSEGVYIVRTQQGSTKIVARR